MNTSDTACLLLLEDQKYEIINKVMLASGTGLILLHKIDVMIISEDDDGYNLKEARIDIEI